MNDIKLAIDKEERRTQIYRKKFNEITLVSRRIDNIIIAIIIIMFAVKE